MPDNVYTFKIVCDTYIHVDIICSLEEVMLVTRHVSAAIILCHQGGLKNWTFMC